MASSCSSSCTVKYLITLSLVFAMYLLQNIKNCNAFQTFGFEMHHRFSDQVKAVIGGDDLPEIGSREYHAAMVHRDKVFRGLDSKLLTLSDGIEETSNIASLIGSLHYATVSLGTPSLLFLVALDTGTNLLWVPCDCATCTPVVLDKNPLIKTNLNIYNINSSSTSKYVPCNSSLCELRSECSKSSSQCPYQAVYNGNINSSGVLVEDVLRLKKEINKPKEIDARITFGCGQVQTGIYFNGTARSGLFGLGIGNTSVPSILSMQGLVANSFSMCFGSDWVGKIIFGDKGSSDLAETPLNPMQEDPWYNISVAQLSVGGNLSHHLLDVTAVFYSGSEYTYLNDPAYTALCDSFNSQTLHKRLSYDFDADFEYCYDVSSESTELVVPNVTLVMKGGSQFNVYNPMVPIKNDDGTVTAYCLGVIKSSKENFIGNNFMTGHHIVFDREKMVLGWKESNCTDEIVDSETQPRIPQTPKLSTPKNGLNSRATVAVSKPQKLILHLM
ncbi:hypothetical protein MKX03_036815 [Papaver bracteatum]|nr:hypothetical protein MKX03_036815 [Papaver bracteatum]